MRKLFSLAASIIIIAVAIYQRIEINKLEKTNSINQGRIELLEKYKTDCSDEKNALAIKLSETEAMLSNANVSLTRLKNQISHNEKSFKIQKDADLLQLSVDLLPEHERNRLFEQLEKYDDLDEANAHIRRFIEDYRQKNKPNN
jgi:hypothetical protein